MALYGLNTDQLANVFTIMRVGHTIAVSGLAVHACLCIGAGENNFNTHGCDTVYGTHCGLFQLSPGLRAEHDYTDNNYWTARAYQTGFWSYGGLANLAARNPSASPGMLANMCQGAYADLAAGAAYYNGYAREADDLINAYWGQAAGGGGGGFWFPLDLRSVIAPERAWTLDQGVDIAAPAHTALLAVGPGTVTSHGIGGFGPWAPVLHLDSGEHVYYGHAGPGNWTNDGTRVAGGQTISEVGAGIVGISTSPHLEIGYCDQYGNPTPGTAVTMLHNLQASFATGNSGVGLPAPTLPTLDFLSVGFDFGQTMHLAFDALGGGADSLYRKSSYVIAEMDRITYCGEHGAF